MGIHSWLALCQHSIPATGGLSFYPLCVITANLPRETCSWPIHSVGWLNASNPCTRGMGLCLLTGWQWPRASGRRGTEWRDNPVPCFWEWISEQGWLVGGRGRNGHENVAAINCPILGLGKVNITGSHLWLTGTEEKLSRLLFLVVLLVSLLMSSNNNNGNNKEDLLVWWKESNQQGSYVTKSILSEPLHCQ